MLQKHGDIARFLQCIKGVQSPYSN